VSVKIPMIYGEDIGKYTDYLRTWLEINQRNIGQWEDLFISTIGWCSVADETYWTKMPNLEESKENLVVYFDKAKKNIQSNAWLVSLRRDLDNIISSDDDNLKIKTAKDILIKKINSDSTSMQERQKLNKRLSSIDLWSSVKVIEDRIKEIDKQLKKNNTCMKFISNKSLSQFIDFQTNTKQLTNAVRQNIRVLEEYKKFPFEIYEWIHVQDRYLAEVSSMSANFVGTIMMWMESNAERLASYVDAMVAMMSSIKTWQILIDLSANWSSKCGKCSVDTYDQYSCKLAFICPSLTIIPIPPFKIPNIFIDLSHIKLGMEILLPKFNFVPMRVTLPELPNLPKPPIFNFDLDMDTQLDFGVDIISDMNMDVNFDFGKIMIPTIPILPEPPDLPELPSFLPSVEMELPVLPPAPQIPALSPKIEALVEVADWVGKIFCILKWWIWLVAENAVKSKIEQITQRSYNVPIFDEFDLTLEQKEVPLKWFDYKIDSYVAMEFNFDQVFEYIEWIVTAVNSATTQVVQVVTEPVENAINSVNNTISSGTAIFDDGVDYYENKLNDKMEEMSSSAKSRTGLDNVKEIIDYEEKLKDLPQEVVDSLENLPQSKIDEMKNRTKDEFDQYREQYLDSYFPQHKFTYVDYKTATRWLLKSLAFLKDYVKDNNFESEKVSALIALLNEDFEVQSNIVWLKDIQQQVNYFIDKKRTEVENLSEMISGDYEEFLDLVEDNYVSLVSDEQENIGFDLSLFTAKQSTIDLLDSQENPSKTYLKMAKNEVGWYLNALNNNSARSLNMTITEHQKTTAYLKNVNDKIDEVLPLFDQQNGGQLLVYSDWPLIAQWEDCQSCSNDDGGSSNSPWMSMDLSQYVKWIFVPSGSGTMVNVVNSEEIVSQIKNNYLLGDINDDNLDDVLMWNKNSVYIKYAMDNFDYGGSVSEEDNRYYFWHIDGVSSLEALLDDGWYKKFSYLKIKLWDVNWEVKNFAMRWQKFDTISFSWKNTIFAWDNPDWYLLEFNHRVDTFYDDEQEYFYNDEVLKEKKYILMLPKWVEWFTGWYISLDEGLWMIDDLLTGTISQVKFYNKNKSQINLTLRDMPRAWQYAKITTLRQEQTRYWQSLFVDAPWSNQIVAGRQILADTVGPEPIITLERIATSDVLSTWEFHEWYVSTYYNLNAFWEDNVVVKDMWIDYQWETILSWESFAKTGIISLQNLFFTGVTTLKFDFWAQDVNENIEKQEVKLDIVIPDISIVDIKPLNYDTRLVVAELSHDIDKWVVTFEKNRSDIWQELEGTNDSAYGGYFVEVGDTVITWWIYDFGYDIGIFDVDGVQVGELSPINGELTIYPEYISVIDVRMDFDSHLPKIEIFDTRVNNILFWITLPMQKLVDMNLHQWSQNYSIVDLDATQFKQFAGWKSLITQDNEILLYVSSDGKIYVPSPLNTSLNWEYSFDEDTENVQYIIKDSVGRNIVTIDLKVDPFITSR